MQDSILTASKTCTCIIGFTLNSTGQCAPNPPCSTLCNTCTGPSTCTQCKSFSALNSGQCTCISGFWYDPAAKVCVPCDMTCAKCSNNTSCDICKSVDHIRPAANQVCKCSSSSKFLDPTNGNCVSCHPSCSTCLDAQATSCLTCAIGFSLSGSKCLPPSNQIWSGTGYSTCDPTCLSCSGTTSFLCTNCLPSAMLLPSNACGCQAKYYLSLAGICLSCHPTCRSCSGPNINQCTGCDSSAQYSGGSCSCTTSLTMFSTGLDSGICVSCHYSCLTCDYPLYAS